MLKGAGARGAAAPRASRVSGTRSTSGPPGTSGTGTSGTSTPQHPFAPFSTPSTLFTALLLVTAAAYYPAWIGGFLWDDDRHVTKAALRSLDGLRRIWFEPGATQQYYPLAHSAFWLMHRLFGDATPGYHVVNVLLHAGSAFLFALVLRRLAVPGAALAAFAFAMHPMHVESVAWISELKNTLSGVFYLGAASAYLRFDAHRNGARWALAGVLFVLALLTKTVTATLPAALLVVFWWQRGRIEWRRDVVPLLPLFAIGIAAGLWTAWVERTHIGARGAEFDLSVVERALVAGRAAWFYLAKVFWPVDLTFVYPRWTIDASAWWQYLYPAAAVAALAVLFALRHRSRGPLATALLFAGTLVPALGFVSVYPLRFSFVADHFAYLASLPVLAAVSALGSPKGLRYDRSHSRVISALGSPKGLRYDSTRPDVAHLSVVAQPFRAAVAAAVLVVLGTLTFVHARDFRDAETLYRATLARNPSAWMVHVNLGILLMDRDLGEARSHFEAALRLRPDLPEAHSNLGMTLHRAGDLARAVAEYRDAVRLDPGLAEAHANLCGALNQLGRHEDAALACARSLALHDQSPEAHYHLGVAAQALGRPEAEQHLREAIRLKPDLADAHNRLGAICVTTGRHLEAVAHFTDAIRLKPDFADAHFNLANLLQGLGRLDDAVASYERALASNRDDFGAWNNLGVAFERIGRRADAARAYREALRVNPSSAQARENLARVAR